MKKIWKNVIHAGCFILLFYLFYEVWRIVLNYLVGIPTPATQFLLLIIMVSFNVVAAYLLSKKVTDIIAHYYKL